MSPIAPVASLALGYDKLPLQANIQHVEDPHRGSYTHTTPENSDTHGATGTASAQHEIHMRVEVLQT